jgi:hypothetical protein
VNENPAPRDSVLFAMYPAQQQHFFYKPLIDSRVQKKGTDSDPCPGESAAARKQWR